MERVASLILNLRNGTEDESATNVEHHGAHGDGKSKEQPKHSWIPKFKVINVFYQELRNIQNFYCFPLFLVIITS